MEEFMKTFANWCTGLLQNIISALLIYFIGKWIINRIMSLLSRYNYFGKKDPTVSQYFLNVVKGLLYALLIIAIINALGVSTASVIAVLTSASVAIGLAVQGALSNLAAGIMLMLLRPFSVGDYVSAGGAEGAVKDLNVFYTTLNTLDNKVITVPNSTLMSSNVVNYSKEATRRVDLDFYCAKGTDINQVRSIMQECMKKNEMVLPDPAPFAELIGGDDHMMTFEVRAWCKGTQYWDLYVALNREITIALADAGILSPAVRVVQN